MKIANRQIDLFIPDGKPVEDAVKRTTHMAISAHQDDIEFMAYKGILDCLGKKDKWFFGVVATNGAGSPRSGMYSGCSDEEMQGIRKREQEKAAYVGEYGALAQLRFTSGDVKSPGNREVIDSLKELITLSRPEVVYTHNPADKHDTHIGVVIKVIQAIREMDKDMRPAQVYGCEVWRNLDWMNDDDKVVFDVSEHPNIAAALVGVFDSQICGGKRYDIAAIGRRNANATFSASHGVDSASGLIYGMNLTPLIQDDRLDIGEYVKGYIDRFSNDVMDKIKKQI